MRRNRGGAPPRRRVRAGLHPPLEIDGRAKRLGAAWLVGAATLAAYLAVAHTARILVRPLYDVGPVSQPYRFASPPPGFAKNGRPLGADMQVDMERQGSTGESVTTGDGQATLIMPPHAFPPHAGDTKLRVRITPLDPATLGPSPRGLPYQGNAYRIAATYEPGGTPARPSTDVTVLLRYPASATALLQRSGGGWVRLKAQVLTSTLQIYANTRTLGTFVAAGAHSTRVVLYEITAAISLLAAAIGIVLGVRERRRPPPRR